MHELTFDQLKFWQLWVISDIKVYVQQKLIEILRVSMYIEYKWSRHYPPKFKVSWLFKLSANHVHLIIVCPYLMGRRMVRWCPCIQYGFLSFGLWLLSKEKWGELLNARFCRFIHDIKNNAWVTVNNDFWVTSEAICQWFSRVTKSRVKIIGKSHHEWPKNRYSR